MEDDEVIDTPQLTPEQIERGCIIKDGRVACPNPDKKEGNAELGDGMTNISLGKQEIESLRCGKNKRDNKLHCTVVSSGKT